MNNNSKNHEIYLRYKEYYQFYYKYKKYVKSLSTNNPVYKPIEKQTIKEQCKSIPKEQYKSIPKELPRKNTNFVLSFD